MRSLCVSLYNAKLASLLTLEALVIRLSADLEVRPLTVCARSVVLQRSGSARYAMGRTAVTLDATHRYALGALHVLALPPVLISLFATGKRHGLSLAAHRLGARIGTLDVDRSLCKAVSCWDGATGARSRALGTADAPQRRHGGRP